MVIKVDFDLTMSILAHNIYKLLARDLPGYEQNTAATLYEKFIHNGGTVEIDEEKVCVSLRKKRHHPVLFTALYENPMIRVPWLRNRKLHLEIASSS
ncbi:MAG: hypothetical protein K940chlam7_02045 [Chlamydiae bacterium]|nr:hypothetical protein [Chlamydiota bacterium]